MRKEATLPASLCLRLASRTPEFRRSRPEKPGRGIAKMIFLGLAKITWTDAKRLLFLPASASGYKQSLPNSAGASLGSCQNELAGAGVVFELFWGQRGYCSRPLPLALSRASRIQPVPPRKIKQGSCQNFGGLANIILELFLGQRSYSSRALPLA